MHFLHKEDMFFMIDCIVNEKQQDLYERTMDKRIREKFWSLRISPDHVRVEDETDPEQMYIKGIIDGFTEFYKIGMYLSKDQGSMSATENVSKAGANNEA